MEEYIKPVRCKDCRYFIPYEKPVEDFDGRCFVRECETDEEEYCSYSTNSENLNRQVYMNTNAKYLRVTIHDNDFTSSLKMISNLLYETFQYEGRYPTEEDFPVLKECIKHLWFGEHLASSLMRWGERDTVDINYFEPHLEFVDFSDIPVWDNDESVYIPMFDNAEVF
jgi:hypothetical protein